MPAGAEPSRGMLRAGGHRQRELGSRSSWTRKCRRGRQGISFQIHDKMAFARGMPTRKTAWDFGAGTPEAGEAKLGVTAC